VGKVSRTAVVVWSLFSVAGCSAIAGLDAINEDDCAPNCGTDASVIDSSTGGDGPVQTDSAKPDTATPEGDSSNPMPDSSTSDDSGMTGTDTGSGGMDSSVLDTGTVVDAPPYDDAPFDSGCGNLNTTTNCAACGDTCNPVNATSATCCQNSTCPGSSNGAGNSCQYTCGPGYLDCNGPAGTDPPNTDGCECHAPGATASQCCAGACPVSHVTGLVGQTYYPKSDTFYDCIPSGTYNIQLALDACGAYVTARGGGTEAANCAEFGPTDGGPPDSVCAITSLNCGSNCTGFDNDCICWTISGTYEGQVFDPVAQGAPDNRCYYGSSPLTFK
jgi:hypothetical protein